MTHMINGGTQKLRELLDTSGLVPNKALGQNFLTDENAIAALLDAADARGKPVLEIGAGLGALTEGLIARAARVAAVEIDARMAAVLKNRFGGALLLYNEDFLRCDLEAIWRALGGEAVTVTGNLPYYATTPICTRLFSCALPIERMTLMVQREAAERFFAKPGDRVYGPMTVLAQAYYTPARILALPPESYYPKPEVYSEAVTLLRNGEPYREKLADLVKACFAMRRKTLYNNLKGYCGVPALERALDGCGIAPSARAETLAPERFLRLSEQL